MTMMRSVQPATLRVAPGKRFQPVFYTKGKFAHGIERAGDGYVASRRNITAYGLEPKESEAFATPEEALAWCQQDFDYAMATQPGTEPEPGEEPVLNSINPSSATIGGPDVSMNVNGNRFTESSLIYFNGGAEPTEFVDSGQLRTTVKPSTATVAGDFPVWVQQGSYQTEQKMFTFNAPA